MTFTINGKEYVSDGHPLRPAPMRDAKGKLVPATPTVTQQMVDDAAINAFKNDLEDMTPEKLQRELDEVTDRIDEDTAWQEALAAALRRNKEASR